MKRILLLLCAMSLVLWIVGISSAAVYNDTYDPYDIKLSESSYPHSTSWTHSIVADQGYNFSGNYGFNPATEDIVSATIRLWFSDDSGYDSDEEFELRIGSNVFTWEVDDNNTSTQSKSWALISLDQDGTMNVTLEAEEGDFIFEKSMLTANTTNTPGCDPVPEPGTLILLGSGLVGLAGYAKIRINGRKRK